VSVVWRVESERLRIGLGLAIEKNLNPPVSILHIARRDQMELQNIGSGPERMKCLIDGLFDETSEGVSLRWS